MVMFAMFSTLAHEVVAHVLYLVGGLVFGFLVGGVVCAALTLLGVEI